MANILERIVTHKREEVANHKRQYPIHSLEQQIGEQKSHTVYAVRPFTNTLCAVIAKKQPAIIAECKRASPSKGVLRQKYKVNAIASDYQAHGAICLSVLTDTQFFGGKNDDLLAAKSACTVPVLRKDFIIDSYQITEARAIGADCVLLILAILDDTQIRDFSQQAFAYGMDVLIEAHQLAEVERALHFAPKLLGINNRNLKTSEVRLQTTFSARTMIPDDITLISESGITSKEDIETMRAHNVYGFLIGEHLMRNTSPGKTLSALLF